VGTSSRRRAAAWRGSRPICRRALLPRDPNDERNIFLEIRAGAGGDGRPSFAADLIRMYTRYAERQGWQAEIISESLSELGGYKEVDREDRRPGRPTPGSSSSPAGIACSAFRKPSAGRIHTSECTVAVLPEADALDDVVLNPAELRIVPSAPRAPAASTSTRPSPRSASPTCRPGSWSSAGLRARSTRTARRRSRAGGAHPRQAAAEQQAKTASTAAPDRLGRPLRAHPHLQLSAGPVTDHRINLTLYKIDRSWTASSTS